MIEMHWKKFVENGLFLNLVKKCSSMFHTKKISEISFYFDFLTHVSQN